MPTQQGPLPCAMRFSNAVPSAAHPTQGQSTAQVAAKIDTQKEKKKPYLAPCTSAVPHPTLHPTQRQCKWQIYKSQF